MTEDEWQACADPQRMLSWVYAQGRRCGPFAPVRSRRSTRRAVRLLVCAGCRLVWDELADPRARAIVETAEAYADNPSATNEINAARDAAVAGYRQAGEPSGFRLAWLAAVEQAMVMQGAAGIICAVSSRWAHQKLGTEPDSVPYSGPSQKAAWQAARAEACRTFCDLLRDLFASPFRRAALLPKWRTTATLLLARAAYEERLLPSGQLDPACLAVLSDALEETGCDDAALLSHLRSPGPPIRGCWAVDLVLDRA